MLCWHSFKEFKKNSFGNTDKMRIHDWHRYQNKILMIFYICLFFYNSSWYDKGIRFVKDILSRIGTCIDRQEVENRTGLKLLWVMTCDKKLCFFYIKWFSVFQNEDLPRKDIQLCTLASNIIKATKLHSLQIRITHRILGTNASLYKLKKNPTELCLFL